MLWYYVVEGLSSHAVALMLASIYFYTTRRFGWGSAQNFLLAAALGVSYVLGALWAHAVALRLGRRGTLVLMYGVMSVCAAAALWLTSPAMLVVILLIYSGLSAITWPALESLVSGDAEPGQLARRLGVYNCVWSGAGAVTVAAAGTILKYWPSGIFAQPAIVHAAMAVLRWGVGVRKSRTPAPPNRPSLSCFGSERWRCGCRGWRCRRRSWSSAACWRRCRRSR